MEAKNRPQPSLRPMQDITPPPGGQQQPPEKPVEKKPEEKPSFNPGVAPQAANVDIVSPPADEINEPPSISGESQPPTSNNAPQQAAQSADSTKDHDEELETIVKEVHDEQNKATEQGPKSSKPILVAVIALIVAMLLGVAAFFTFRNTEETGSGGTNNGSTSQTATVKPEDLSTASKDIEAQLNQLNDEQDFGATEVSDEKLGL